MPLTRRIPLPIVLLGLAVLASWKALVQFEQGELERVFARLADTVQMDSNSRFHYDEALGNYGGSNSFRVSSWRELRPATERATYEDELNF